MLSNCRVVLSYKKIKEQHTNVFVSEIDTIRQRTLIKSGWWTLFLQRHPNHLLPIRSTCQQRIVLARDNESHTDYYSIRVIGTE